MNIRDFIHIIKHTNLFNTISSEELVQLFTSPNYEIKEYNKNKVIYLQNEKCTTLDIILKGSIIVQKIDTNGNVLTISTFSTGDVIGGNLIFANTNTYPMTVASRSSCIILHINKDLILELCQKNRNFLIEFIKSISDKTIILTNKIKSISMKTIRQCILDFLTYEYYIQKTSKIILPVSKKDLAERIGVQRPSLLRELNKMRRDGLIEYDAHSITIKDVEFIKKN
ncbi:CRP-like cAMP-binding protein [Clostridium pascui]|uniref:Crp/Fnr family transcriptional regulator n=1 Tax=Clostridium pascui TaxID=46609 RepID=UPI00195CFBDE|nr:Crp/Fnr family transcriptional regulator [Clostridium pascui]MBM7869132.1 CRP-like cAMP-binding protein [Clostridium pascui]